MSEPVSANSGKDTVYIDVDDEITTIIDKVNGSKERIVALVLPKRASVLQSTVNMKLLKRSAETAKKQLVLITTESGLLPLAGSIGLYVADSLQSKPEVPPAPKLGATAPAEESLNLDDEPEQPYNAANAANRSVGELSDKTAASGSFPITAGVETDNLVTSPTAPEAPAKPKKGTNKKLHVPNFGKFRTRLGLAIIGLILLVFLIYLALMVLPQASIAIQADSTDINSSLNVNLDTTADAVDLASSTVPATAAQQQKTYTQQVAASGKQNNGDKADGSVTMTACVSGFDIPSDVPAGTGISTGGLTYITQDDATFSPSGPDQAHACYKYDGGSVDIIAQGGGANYNAPSGTDFSVAGRKDVSASGSASGGTDQIEQIVTQSDIDSAKGKIQLKDDEIKQALYQQLKQQNLFPINATFNSGKPAISTSNNAGDAASSVTVTENVTYSMFGTNRNNLLKLIKDDVAQQIDTSKQAIIDDGLDKASFSVQDTSDTVVKVSMDNTASIGPKINMDDLKKQIAGKKSGNAKDIISQIPGVTNVDVKLSPFWVSSIPGSTSKITIKVTKADKTHGDNS